MSQPIIASVTVFQANRNYVKFRIGLSFHICDVPSVVEFIIHEARFVARLAQSGLAEAQDEVAALGDGFSDLLLPRTFPRIDLVESHVDLALFQVVVERLDRVEVFVGVAEENALFSGHGSWSR